MFLKGKQTHSRYKTKDSKQTQMKTTIYEVKSTLDGIHEKLDIKGEISEMKTYQYRLSKN